jgi:hypothetical protein
MLTGQPRRNTKFPNRLLRTLIEKLRTRIAAEIEADEDIGPPSSLIFKEIIDLALNSLSMFGLFVWTGVWHAGPWRNTNACAGIGAEPRNGCTKLPCGTRSSLLTGLCCTGRRLIDKSRMSGDVHVRICERLGV